MEDKRIPDGECAGKEMPDRGCMTGVTETYGTGKKDLQRGYSGGTGIGADTRSDK